MANRCHHPGEVHSLSDMDRPATKANIHGAFITISPVKKESIPNIHSLMVISLTKQTSKPQLVGFESFQQRMLADYHDRQVPVEITMEIP